MPNKPAPLPTAEERTQTAYANLLKLQAQTPQDLAAISAAYTELLHQQFLYMLHLADAKAKGVNP